MWEYACNQIRVVARRRNRDEYGPYSYEPYLTRRVFHPRVPAAYKDGMQTGIICLYGCAHQRNERKADPYQRHDGPCPHTNIIAAECFTLECHQVYKSQLIAMDEAEVWPALRMAKGIWRI